VAAVNPFADTFSSYRPGTSRPITNAPAASLVNFRALPLPLDTMIAADGTSAPSGSVTVPAIVPVALCAQTCPTPISIAKTNRTAIFIVIL
jgi:hypothetical protein